METENLPDLTLRRHLRTAILRAVTAGLPPGRSLTIDEESVDRSVSAVLEVLASETLARNAETAERFTERSNAETPWCVAHRYQAGSRGFCWEAVSATGVTPADCRIVAMRLTPKTQLPPGLIYALANDLASAGIPTHHFAAAKGWTPEPAPPIAAREWPGLMADPELHGLTGPIAERINAAQLANLDLPDPDLLARALVGIVLEYLHRP